MEGQMHTYSQAIRNVAYFHNEVQKVKESTCSSSLPISLLVVLLYRLQLYDLIFPLAMEKLIKQLEDAQAEYRSYLIHLLGCQSVSWADFF